MDINTKLKLNTGAEIPQFGFGVWQAEDGEETRQSVLWAIEAGYRHIDTAAIYGNECSVGEAIKQCGVAREELFVTTKLWNGEIRAGNALKAFDESLEKLDMDYVDLYLIHWPVEGYEKAWKDMEQIYKTGRAKAIGVSNFKQHHLQSILDICETTPAANQMEYNPQMQDDALLEMCKQKGIVFEAWSPLGAGNLEKQKMEDAAQIGEKYGKSPQQTILRWILQKGIVVFPKSVHQNRIVQNADIFDFELSAEDMAVFNAMNENLRTGADPDHVDF